MISIPWILHRLAYSLNQSIFTFLSRRCHPTLYAYVWASNKMLLHFAGTINQINTASLISSFPIDLVKTRAQRINMSRHPWILFSVRCGKIRIEIFTCKIQWLQVTSAGITTSHVCHFWFAAIGYVSLPSVVFSILLYINC